LTKSLFEDDYIEGKNFLNLICKYSKFKLVEKFKDEFFTFNISKVLDYTIKTNEKNFHFGSHEEQVNSLSEVFNSYKTLYSVFSLWPNQNENNIKACKILIKTKLADIRENFDELIYNSI
jgi:hypothetical protein